MWLVPLLIPTTSDGWKGISQMQSVTQLVSERAYADDSLAEDAKLLVVAALESDAALADMAGSGRATQSRDERTSETPTGAFIKSVEVSGFRGVGPSTTLALHPGPGLTIVAGRNGSGKSSIAEAVEFALTGTTYRWKEKPSVQWSRGWRNLHEGAEPRIDLVLAEERLGATTVQVRWPRNSADVESARVHLQRRGLPRESGLDALGWTAALDNHRPMLSYDELGALLVAEPSRLYDALAKVLGLEEITLAIRRLEAHNKSLNTYRKDVGEAKAALTLKLVGDDERVVQALKLVKASDPDSAALRTLASGVGDEGAISALRQLSQLPGPVDVDSVATQLRQAVGALAAASDEHLFVLQRQLGVWRAAAELHGHVGDGPCPVCGDGLLDVVVADRLRERTADAEQRLGQLTACKEQLRAAQGAANDLMTSPPRVLMDHPASAVAEMCADVAADWRAWATRPEGDDLALAEHLERTTSALNRKVAELRDAATAELDRLDSAWQPIASLLTGYADLAERWRSHKPAAKAAKAALTWLKDNDTTLKNERIAPIANHAAEIWESLRQQSNVEFHGLRLSGTATRRHVEIASTVDGHEGAGLAVLSQGELHALALALFIPRAVMAESPFRFVVLDDPVQAMDPAKVDGLIGVLKRLAESRQVIVFSHDDRLAEAARRAGGDATILEVSRAENSQISIVTSRDPAARYLQDAFALVMDDHLPDTTLRRVLPNMLRFALEAEARRRYFGTRLSHGDVLTDVETHWSGAQRTGRRIALALGIEDNRLNDWISRSADRRVAREIWSRGVHEGLTGDAMGACRAVESVLTDIREGRR